MRLFIEDNKGIVDVVENVDEVKIATKERTKYLLAYDTHTFREKYCTDARKLSSIKLAYLIDTETMNEYFRYEK